MKPKASSSTAQKTQHGSCDKQPAPPCLLWITTGARDVTKATRDHRKSDDNVNKSKSWSLSAGNQDGSSACLVRPTVSIKHCAAWRPFESKSTTFDGKQVSDDDVIVELHSFSCRCFFPGGRTAARPSYTTRTCVTMEAFFFFFCFYCLPHGVSRGGPYRAAGRS